MYIRSKILDIFWKKRSRLKYENQSFKINAGYFLILQQNWMFRKLLDIPTESRKKRNLAYSIRMYWTNVWPPTVHEQQNISGKSLIEVGNTHLYASFGTFCVQIGQLFESQWDFKLRFLNQPYFASKTAILPFSNNFQKLTNFDAKGAKRSTKV